MPFFLRLIDEKRELLLCLKLLLKVTYMQAFSSGRRCHDEGVTDEVSSIKCIHFLSTAILFHLWGKANKKPSP
jgi:hypothetical protein